MAKKGSSDYKTVRKIWFFKEPLTLSHTGQGDRQVVANQKVIYST